MVTERSSGERKDKKTLVAGNTAGDGGKPWFSINPSPETGSGESISTSAVDAIIVAYGRFFKAIYHLPLDITVADSPAEALIQLAGLANVADAYNTLEPLQATVHAFICNNLEILREYFPSQASDVIKVASKLEIDWLAKDIICLACGDNGKTDNDIRREYDPEIAKVILDKRAILRTMMHDVNYKLLLLKTSSTKSLSKSAKIELREGMIENVLSAQEKPWSQYADIYNEEGLGWLHDWVDSGSFGDEGYTDIIDEIDDILEPLYECKLSPKSVIQVDKNNLSDRLRSEVQRFTCIEVSDCDLPWCRF
ncbi:MAG: hypothetical protein Q9220_003250 [cf. Caloplaca sp. 1 TL-2023]